MNDFEELLNDINNKSVMVTTSKPYKNVSHLRDDLLFVSDATNLLGSLKALNDPDNSILIILNNGVNVEIKLDESLIGIYPMVIAIDEKKYEVIESYDGEELNELTDFVQNDEHLRKEQKEALNSQNIVQYIQDHLISVDSDDKYMLEEIKTAQAGSSYGLSALLYDYTTTPQTGKLDTGESVKFHQWEESVEHDGAEIGIVIEVDGRCFIDYGSYNSWDSSYFNENFTEVQRVEVPIIKVEYHAI